MVGEIWWGPKFQLPKYAICQEEQLSSTPSRSEMFVAILKHYSLLARRFAPLGRKAVVSKVCWLNWEATWLITKSQVSNCWPNSTIWFVNHTLYQCTFPTCKRALQWIRNNQTQSIQDYLSLSSRFTKSKMARLIVNNFICKFFIFCFGYVSSFRTSYVIDANCMK